MSMDFVKTFEQVLAALEAGTLEKIAAGDAGGTRFQPQGEDLEHTLALAKRGLVHTPDYLDYHLTDKGKSNLEQIENDEMPEELEALGMMAGVQAGGGIQFARWRR